MKAWIDEHRVIHAASIDHVGKLCTKEDRWTMTVPVRESDSDVMLTGALESGEKALSMIEAVLELHEPINGFVGDPSHWECNVCGDDRGPKPYPCPTVRALEGVTRK